MGDPIIGGNGAGHSLSSQNADLPSTDGSDAKGANTRKRKGRSSGELISSPE
jgi:hypothetical protein